MFDDLILSSPGIPPFIQNKHSSRIIKLKNEGEEIADTDDIQKINVIKENDSKPSQLREDQCQEEDSPLDITAPPDIRINMDSLNIPSDLADSELLGNLIDKPKGEYVDKNSTRRKSINEIDVSDIIISDMDKPFENERAKYELQRFLQAKDI